MDHLAGFRLRQARLAQNLSQAGLCRGICAVSYLSKIEQGRAEPGADILRLLFARLRIVYEDDPAFIAQGRALLRRLTERSLLGEDCAAEEAQLAALGERLDRSPLSLDYRLVRALRAPDEEVLPRLRALEPYVPYMDEGAQFLCALLHGLHDPLEEALVRLRQADALRPCSVVSSAAAARLFCAGRCQEALRHCAQGYARAAEEGCLPMMRELSLTEANCYANLFNHTLMLRAFARTAALCQDDESLLAQIDYNIGASFLEKQRWSEALEHLERARAYDGRPGVSRSAHDRCMTLHKLAICLLELGRRDEALQRLAEAETEAAGLPAPYRDMLRLVALRARPGYNDDDEYFELLQTLCGTLGCGTLHAGFRQFHRLFLLEALTHRRRYREAYLLAREMNPMFSQELPEIGSES